MANVELQYADLTGSDDLVAKVVSLALKHAGGDEVSVANQSTPVVMSFQASAYVQGV
jgi:hypothetical protein